MTRREDLPPCITGGRAPCPICPVHTDCAHGQNTVRAKALWNMQPETVPPEGLAARRMRAIYRRAKSHKTALTPSKTGRTLSKLAAAKCKKK